MIFYSWVAVSGSNPTPSTQTDPAESGPPVAMGITDDRARAINLLFNL